MADKPDAFACPQGQVDAVNGDLPPIKLRTARMTTVSLSDEFVSHGVSRSSADGRGGLISGAVSITPPGWIAGNRACAQRTI